MSQACGKCGKIIKPGELRYELLIQLTSMFDGVLDEPDDAIDEEIDRLLQAVNRQDPAAVEADVAQTIRLEICRACRNAVVRQYSGVADRVVH